MDVAIVGGGIIGLALAELLLEKRCHVTIFESGESGGASSRAAGILGAQFESHEDSPFFEELLSAREGFVPWVRSLGGEQALAAIDYRASGVLRVAASESSAEALARVVRFQAAKGLRAAVLSEREVRALEPDLGPAPFGGAHFPDDAQLDPAPLVALLRRVVEERGAVFRRERVVALEEDATHAGVVLEDGSRVSASQVVIANGAWASKLRLPGKVLSVPPKRGQMFRVRPRTAHFRAVIERGGTYALARGDLAVDCGATVEDAGFSAVTTDEGIADLRAGLAALVPALAALPVERAWAGLRPFADLPIEERLSPGTFVTSGHYRNGILLARHSAERTAAALLAPQQA